MANVPVRLARQQVLRILDGQCVQVPTSVGLLEVEAKTDQRWQPLKCRPHVPAHIIHAHIRTIGMRPPDQLWFNDEYEIFVYFTEEGGAHLSIKRMDRASVRNWRHLQQIKNEIVGEEREALELFPRESRVTDNANQMHLWVMPEGLDIPVGFADGFVTIREDEVAAFNEAGGKARQEPMQEGLTVGRTLQAAQDRDGLTPAQEVGRMVNRARPR